MKKASKRKIEWRHTARGSDYQPWFHIKDVPSLGLATRIYGNKTGRLHCFLSRLESDYFYMLEGDPSVVDIREQYPLPKEETLILAEEVGIRHPTNPRTKEPVTMTSDFLVTVQDGQEEKHYIRTVKYTKDLASKRVLGKLELERAFWSQREVEWAVVTEKDIPRIFVQNMRWMHPYFDVTQHLDLSPRILDRVDQVLYPKLRVKEGALANCAADCDDVLGLKPGTSLMAARHFFAVRRWRIDLSSPLDPTKTTEVYDDGRPLA